MTIFSLIAESTALAVSLAFIFGTVIGSFLNVLIWRLPRDEKVQGRSHCPHCEHVLAWYDLIPVASFLSMRGRCRYCKKAISFRYPAIEIITGLLFAIAIWLFPPVGLVSWLVLLKIIFVIAVCIVVFMVDLEHYLILDKVIFPSIAILLGFLIAIDLAGGTTHNLVHGVAAALVGFLPFWAMWKFSDGKWMGFGDVKFMVLMGLALGIPGIIVALLIAFIFGAIIGISLILLGKKNMSSKLPFGTFLTVSTVVAILYGAQLWGLYWNLFVV